MSLLDMVRGFAPSRIGALVVCLALAACGGRPVGVLTPTPTTAAGTSRVDLLAVTTRKPTATPGLLFSGERDSKISLTDIKISIPPAQNRKVGDVQWPKKLPPNPSTDFATISTNELTVDQARTWFRSQSRGKRHVLLFVHGFNNTYEDAVYRFAQIYHDSGAPAVPILFTWPSRASVLAYNYDRESTVYSRDALEQTLQALAKEPSVDDVSVLAHSMGSFLTLEALRQMSIRSGRIAPKIRNVILAAPDVDVDVFRQQLGEMGPPNERPHFTIFTSTDDRALLVSSRIAGKVPRLGAVDPKAEPYASEFKAGGIDAFDLTDIQSEDQLRHGRYTSEAVVQAIGGRIIEGQKISDDQLSLGQRVGQLAGGVASGAGAAAGAIISAPIAIMDPQTRRSFGDQLDAIGGGFGDAANSFDPQIQRRRASARQGQAAAQPPTTSSAGSSPSNSTRTR
ncbi:alpha/beta hydrolase [Methylopila sp. M107]|uniref:alpha/beta hydrolase n=1 Tax=Methylopila sp. M107 TaxID=1101190 RepID=UPI001FDA36D5|nr:alpha/beta hydrolase [Methylopila sp. M107]